MFLENIFFYRKRAQKLSRITRKTHIPIFDLNFKRSQPNWRKMLKMFTPKTMVNFEGLLMRKNRFLRKNVRFTDQKSKTRYFSTGFCFTICFSILEKHLNVEYMALLWNVGNFGNHDYPSNYIFHQFENATFKCRVLCQRKKNDFCENLFQKLE